MNGFTRFKKKGFKLTPRFLIWLIRQIMTLCSRLETEMRFRVFPKIWGAAQRKITLFRTCWVWSNWGSNYLQVIRNINSNMEVIRLPRGRMQSEKAWWHVLEPGGWTSLKNREWAMRMHGTRKRWYKAEKFSEIRSSGDHREKMGHT